MIDMFYPHHLVSDLDAYRKFLLLFYTTNYLMISDDCSTLKRLGPSKHQRIPSGVGTHSYNAFLSHGVASSRACNNQIAELDWTVGVFHSTWRLFFFSLFFFRIADLLGFEGSMIPTYRGDTIYLLYFCHLGCLFVFFFFLSLIFSRWWALWCMFSNDCILRIFTCVFIMLCYYVVVDTSIRLNRFLSFV